MYTILFTKQISDMHDTVKESEKKSLHAFFAMPLYKHHKAMPVHTNSNIQYANALRTIDRPTNEYKHMHRNDINEGKKTRKKKQTRSGFCFGASKIEDLERFSFHLRSIWYHHIKNP